MNIGVSIRCRVRYSTNLENALAVWDFAADPMDIGRLALRGMRHNDLYILTHPEYAAFIRSRNGFIVDSMPDDVRLSDAKKARAAELLQGTLYQRTR